jgi:hypothetical protein
MKRFFQLLVGTLLGLGLAAAQQQATVNHGVSLRGDPSAQSPPIGHLSRGTTVTLSSSSRKQEKKYASPAS